MGRLLGFPLVAGSLYNADMIHAKRAVRLLLAPLLLAAQAQGAELLGPTIWGINRIDGRDFTAPITAVSTGGSHTLALRADGRVVAWGATAPGATTVPSNLTDVVAIAAGASHSLALRSNGVVTGWGSNVYGQASVGLSDAVAISAGANHSVAIRTNGTVVAWGRNTSGETSVPAGLTDVVAISAGGSHTVALKSDGSVVGWGNNISYQPALPNHPLGYTAVAAGGFHTLALGADGIVVATGSNSAGQCNVPHGLSGVIAIAAGDNHSVALKEDGTVVAWGNNLHGQRSVPTGLTGVVAISAKVNHAFALKSDGTLVAWGDNLYGQRNVPSDLAKLTSIAFGGTHVVAALKDGGFIGWGNNDFSKSTAPVGLPGIKAVAAGHEYTVALKNDGGLSVWGDSMHTPLPIPAAATNIISVAASVREIIATKADGSRVAWGTNLFGQISFPPDLPAGTTIVAGIYHTAALKPDGTVVAFGRNAYGETNVPEGLSGVTAIASGHFHVVALKANGTVVAWGLNDYGQCNVPPGLSSIIAIAAGAAHTVALRANGSVVAWGYNQYGQCTVPTGLTGITAIAAGPLHTVALRTAARMAVHKSTPNGGELSGNGSSQNFGPVSVSDGTRVHTFTIENSGTAALTLGTVSLTGPHANEFEVTQAPAAQVPPNGSTTLQVTYDPSSRGPHSAALSFSTNDPEENAFSFSLSGMGISSVLEVSGNGETLLFGDTSPDTRDGTDFAEVALLDSQVTRTFVVRNPGELDLNLMGPPVVKILGEHADDFKVTAELPDLVGSGDSKTFAITFDPSLPGLRTAVVSIANDDPERDPFTFAVSGFGVLDKLLGQDISFTAPGSVFLGEGPVELAAEASSGLPVTLEVLSGPGTLAGDVLTLTGVGKVTVRATQPGGGNYAPAKAVTRVITVKADPGRLTLTGLSQRYDGTPKAIGTVGAAGMVAVSYQVGGVFGPDAPTAAGRYAVRAVADGVTKTGTLVITKAPLYVVPVNKRKFAGEANPALTLEYEGFVGGDDESALTNAPTLSTTAKTTSPGGVYPITAKGGAAANYALVYRQGTLVVESFAAGYEALLVDALHVPSGKLSLTVAKSGRSYSGSLALAGETTALRVSGPLATNSGTETASGAATVVRNGVTYALTFTLPMNGQMTGAVTRASLELATAQGGRRLLSLPKGGMVDYSGAHTAVLKPAQPAGAGVPAGAGWARATINSGGAIALAGKLGDGTAFTTSLLPDADATPGYRLWLQPYKPARVDTFLGGTFALNQHPVLSRGFVADGASLTWVKAERLPDKSYPEGFVPLEVSLKLDPWIKPSAIQPLAALLGLSGDSIVVAHSTTGSASDADLPTTVTLSTRNAVSVPGGSNPTKWQAKFNTANGTFTGSFELLDAGVKRKAPFSGVLRQPVEASDEVIGDGHFVIPATPGNAETLSGEVLLTRP